MRAFRNSSDFYLFQVEIETLKSILKKNAYPEYFFNKIISEFLSKYGDNENDFERKKNELKNPKPVFPLRNMLAAQFFEQVRKPIFLLRKIFPSLF